MGNIINAIKIMILVSTSFCFKVNKSNSNSNNDSGKDFVEDMITIYAASKTQAENKLPTGYSLLTSDALYSNSDENGNTYLAIKTTNDYKNAITDIRAMNMVGGWSISSYQDVLETKKDEINAVYDALVVGINDFNKKYQESVNLSSQNIETGTSYAALVFDSIYFDDLPGIKDGDVYATLLDVFTTPSLCTKENLQTILLQGNANAINSIFADLLYSAESLNDGGTFDFSNLEFYEEIEDADGCDYFDPIEQSEIDQMVINLSTVKDVLSPFYNSGFADNHDILTNENIIEYMRSLTPTQALDFQISASMFAELSGYTYLGMSLTDFFLNYDSQDDEFDSACVKPFIIEMNEVERALISFSGFESLIRAKLDGNTTYKDNNGIVHSKYNLYKQILKDNLTSLKTKTSIFECVDRRLFTADGVALTSEAIRQNTAKNDYNCYIKENNEKTALLNQIIKLSSIAGGTLLTNAALVYYGHEALYISISSQTTLSILFTKGNFWKACEIWSNEPEFLKYLKSQIILSPSKTDSEYYTEVDIGNTDYQYCYGTSNSDSSGFDFSSIDSKMKLKCSKVWTQVFKFFAAVDLISTISIAVSLIAYFVKEIVKYNTDNIVYAPIPEIMVSEHMNDNGKVVYSNYYNVLDNDGNTADISKASTRKQLQWVALYYTKDTSCGNPIYADSFYFLSDISKDINATGVNKFGENGIYDIFKYTSRKPSSNYICYQSIDSLTYNKKKSVEKIEYFASTLMDIILGKSKQIVETYINKINLSKSIKDVQEILEEALKALEYEKENNYVFAYPIYQRINQLGDSLNEEEINSIRNDYEALTDDQKSYVENIDLLETAENTLLQNKLLQSKDSALNEIEEYINSIENLGNDNERKDILSFCQNKINACETIDDIQNALDYCHAYVDNLAISKKNEAASIFGEGNLGLLFIGLGCGIILGLGGLWITLRILKKRKIEL